MTIADRANDDHGEDALFHRARAGASGWRPPADRQPRLVPLPEGILVRISGISVRISAPRCQDQGLRRSASRRGWSKAGRTSGRSGCV